MLDLEFYKGKRVLVTGHTGFKGTWLCKLLTGLGAVVCGYSLEPPTTPSVFTLSELENEIQSVIGDVRDFEKLQRVFSEFCPEIVLHLAAQPIVRTSYSEPRYTYETNVMGTVNVLECIRRTDSVRSFLNVTTDKVYKNEDMPDHPFREEEPLDGYDPYSNSKSCSELVTHSYQQSFFTDGRCAVSTARAGNVIGGGDFAKDRIIPDCIRAALEKKEIVVRSPHSTRPYQYVLEPLFLYLEICEKQYKDRQYEGCYNVGPDDCDCVTTGELAGLFCEKWGNGARWVDRSDGGPHEASFLKLDNGKVKRVFGWQPHCHIGMAMEKTMEWYHCWQSGGNVCECMERQIQEFMSVSAH